MIGSFHWLLFNESGIKGDHKCVDVMQQSKDSDYQFFQFLKINNPVIYEDIETFRKKCMECKMKRTYLKEQLNVIKSQIKNLEYNINDELMVNNCQRENYYQRKKHIRLLKKEIRKNYIKPIKEKGK